MENKYVSRKIVLKTLGISPLTLIKMVKNRRIEIIETIGGQRKYNVTKYIEDNKQTAIIPNINDDKNKIDTNSNKINICYVRVSTITQKDDLERQKKFMKNKYPTYEIIEDIGSGINFNRKGLRKIIKMAIKGEINKLVVAYKDRLTRFGYELIEDLIKEYSDGEIIIENKKNENKEPKEELVEDVLQILNVYTAKMNGMRKYRKI